MLSKLSAGARREIRTMMTITLMIRSKEDGDYGYDEDPVTKSWGFCCDFIWPTGKYREQEEEYRDHRSFHRRKASDRAY
jgi:hypothetical protein